MQENNNNNNSEQVEANRPIGRASATERSSNTAERFRFWVAPDIQINPFDIVAAEQVSGSETYGLITNIEHTTDAASHLTNFISNDFGSVQTDPNTPRQGTNVAEASVLSNNAEIYMPVQSDAPIRFANERAIHTALGIDAMVDKERNEQRRVRVPAGVIQMSNGAHAVAYLDADYLLGPEAAHLNISGISGLATKTSYATFLIQSALQSLGGDNIAVILLNVKYDDLLHIDEPRELAPEERDLWNQLGLDGRPFDRERVHYILPHGRETDRTHRPNCFGTLPAAYQTYAYALPDAVTKLDLLLSQIPDPADTIGSLLGEIMQGITSNEARWRSASTWGRLLTQPPLMNGGVPQAVGQIRPISVGRFVRLLRRIVSTRQSGIFVENRSTRETTIERALSDLRGGHTYVVDVAKLQPAEQTLVFGDVLRTVYGLFSGDTEDGEENALPDKVIIFVDELNKYAPAHGPAAESPILDQVLEIAERGRSFGIVLFSAQQFLSAVHSRVTGNSATKLLGRTDSAEINESGYRFLDKDIKGHLTRLNKGELILSHPIYRQPVKIVFPRPPFRQGRGPQA